MTIGSRVPWRACPALAGALVAIALSTAQANDRVTLRVERLRELDGRASTAVDLNAVEEFQKRAADRVRIAFEAAGRQRVQDLRVVPHRTGLPATLSKSSRVTRFDPPLPERLRGATLFVVSVARGGAIPPILAGELPKDAFVLVVDAASIADVAQVAARVQRPVSLATAEVARALGVERRDCRVIVASDGRSAAIEEGRP